MAVIPICAWKTDEIPLSGFESELYCFTEATDAARTANNNNNLYV